MTRRSREPGRILRAGQASEGVATLTTHGRGKLAAAHFRPAPAALASKDAR